MSINFIHLRSFYAVARERSVSQAARRLNISQPTLSKQIRELEDRHKVKLIEGARPPLELTGAGQLLFEKARELFGVADEISAILGDDDIGDGTLLRLGTDSPPYAAEFMARMIRDVPGMSFRVSNANAGQTNDLLMRGQIDVGIICEPPIQSAYTYVPIYRDRLVAVLPALWDEAAAATFPLERIARETMLVRESTSRTLAATNRLLTDSGIAPAHTMEMHTREMIREGVACGLGISLMFARECPPDARLRMLPLATTSPAMEVSGYLAFQTERKRLPIIRKAVAVAKAMGSEVTAHAPLQA